MRFCVDPRGVLRGVARVKIQKVQIFANEHVTEILFVIVHVCVYLGGPGMSTAR